MDTVILQLLFGLFVSPWASLVVAYALYAFALHLHGRARSPMEKKLMWIAPIFWSFYTVWAFTAIGRWGPIRIDLLMLIPALMLITLGAIVALTRAAIGRV